MNTEKTTTTGCQCGQTATCNCEVCTCNCTPDACACAQTACGCGCQPAK